MSLSSLGLAPDLVRAAAELGFVTPTPIQQEAIPLVLRGIDLLATAQTGSGKTAAYVLPLLQRLQDSPAHTPRCVRALVLTPTRELAVQVGEVMRGLARHLARRPKVAVLFGGVSINPQMLALRGAADVVVATPGRLLDLLEHNALRLSAVTLLVLDEADRLLDLGFADELTRVLALLPTQRQNLFFSATFPPPLAALAAGLLQQPQRIDIPALAQAQGVVLQRLIQVDTKRRTELLRWLIQHEGWQQVLVFVATQYAADRVATKLHRNGLYATSFHGGLSQGARQQTLAEFKERRWDVLVTTDLAARGIDIEQLPVVVNHDLPRSAVDYVHRIGRTARAGAAGLAVSFVSADTEAHWRLIEKRQGLSLSREQISDFEPTEVATPTHRGGSDNGGIKGKRPSKKDRLRANAAATAPAPASTR